MLSWIILFLVMFIVAVLFSGKAARTKQRAQTASQDAITEAHRNFLTTEGEQRRNGADVLAMTKDPGVISTLLRGRRNPAGSHADDYCVDRALRSLCESLGLDATQARRDYDLKAIGITPVNDLVPWFASTDPVLRDAAMQKVALAVQEAPSGKFADRILALAFSGSAEFNLKQRAAETLVMAHQLDRLVRRAIELLETDSDSRSGHDDAIEVLGRFDAGAEAIPCLIKQAQEQRWGMSPRAIRALTRIVLSKGETLPTDALQSIRDLLTRPVLESIADPDDPGKTNVETVNTAELQTLVSDLLDN